MTGLTPPRRTVPYRRIDDLTLHADVTAPEPLRGTPTVAWIHGGALIMEDRDSVPGWLSDACGDRGWALASIDYRLAPRTLLPDIVGDVDAAFRWLRGEGDLPPPGDVGPIAVVGGSAGGYLSLLAGCRVRPPLAAVVSLWGYGELTGDWYASPSPYPVHHELVRTREEVFAPFEGRPPTAAGGDQAAERWALYQHLRQHGLWPRTLTGWDPVTERDRFVPFMPIELVRPDHPPTLLIHGDRDTDVPYEESVAMAAACEREGVEHRLITVEGGEHGLDGMDEHVVADAYDEAVTFLAAHLVG